MADVTISQLTRGIPTGGSVLPYSSGNSTLSVAASALLQNAGSIGIGTTTPSAILNIKDTSPHLRIDSSTSSWAYTSFNTLNNYSRVGNEGITGGELLGGALPYSAIFGSMNGTTHIGAGGNVILTCTNTGNVGIGTTAPTAKLNVAGDVKATNAPKAWASFNGKAADGTNQPIRASYNITSILRTADNNYIVTFPAGVFSNTNYAFIGSSSTSLNRASIVSGPIIDAPTTTTFRFANFSLVYTGQPAGWINESAENIYIAFFAL